MILLTPEPTVHCRDGMGAVSICLSFGLIMLLLAAHPFLTYPLSLALVRRRSPLRPSSAAPDERLSLAICMSVYNEEAVIAAKVDSLLQQATRYGNATVNIYADGCSDRTVAMLQPYADRLRLIVGSERRGKTAGMQALMEGSESELLLFTDANVEAPIDAAVALARPFTDPAIGCVTARLAYNNASETPTSLLGAFYWRMEEWIKQQEDRTIGLIGVDGAMFMIRRRNYHAAPPSLIDDLYVSLKVLLDGKRVTRLPEVVVVERSATASAEEARRKTRIACQAMNVHRALWPEIRRLPWRLVYGYLSHRLLKWFMPFLLLGAVCGFAAAAVAAFGAVPTGLSLIVCAALFRAGYALELRPVCLLTSATLSLVGVAKGVIESVATDRTYTTWEPVLSVRTDGMGSTASRRQHAPTIAEGDVPASVRSAPIRSAEQP
jgi:cellulose synthase/poly-beta-1,6-N-acetylglucosamine synthase-like glycosyltransferase